VCRAFSSPPEVSSTHNNGDGTFTEVSKGTAIAKALGKGLGVVAVDINNDGRMDLFVANDTVQNFLFMNRGPGSNGRWIWRKLQLQAGVGFSESGRPRSGMGVMQQTSAEMGGRICLSPTLITRCFRLRKQ